LLEPNDRFPSYKCDPAPEQWVRFGAIQVNAQSVDDERVLERVARHVEREAAEGAQVIVLPESFLWAGRLYRSGGSRVQFWSREIACRTLSSHRCSAGGESGRGGHDRRYNTVFLLATGAGLPAGA
jgi:predicted amidohydrolase